jgi:hypothetical protein
MFSSDDSVLGLLRDHMAVLRRASQSLDSAQLVLQQMVHDAWSSGIPAARIAEITGLAEAEVRRIAAAWPSLPEPADPGTLDLVS